MPLTDAGYYCLLREFRVLVFLATRSDSNTFACNNGFCPFGSCGTNWLDVYDSKSESLGIAAVAVPFSPRARGLSVFE